MPWPREDVAASVESVTADANVISASAVLRVGSSSRELLQSLSK